MTRVVVIGGGPAGVEAARAAASHATVTLVSLEPAGTWPYLATQSWLAAVADGERDTALIAARAAKAVSGWQAQTAAELATLEVEVLQGRARLGAPGEVLVEATTDEAPRTLAADAVLVATGAVPELPSGLASDGEAIRTYAQLATLTTIPASALVIGDGADGFETCQILSLLGATVTWLVPEEVPHSHVAPEVDGYLTRTLERHGVQVVPRATVRRLALGTHGVTATLADGTRHGGELAIIMSGRKRDLSLVGLSNDQAVTDIYGQTRRRGVYLVGDALAPRTASCAMAEARAAALHSVGRSSGPAETRYLVQSFMRRPQVARLGKLATEGAHGSVTVAMAECPSAYIEGVEEGFLNLAWDHDGRIAGALAVAPQAAAILAPIAIAMRLGIRLENLADSFGPHPSLSELAALAARKAGL